MDFKIKKGVGVIFGTSPTDEDFIKAQELIDDIMKEGKLVDTVEAEYYRQMDKAIKDTKE